MPAKKKVTKAVEESTPAEVKEENETIVAAEEDSDFADEVKLEEKPVEEVKEEPEEKKEPEPEPEIEQVPPSYEYDSDHLDNIEKSRVDFLALYKKHNTIKNIVSFLLIALIAASWLIPSSIESLQNATLIIALATTAVTLVIMFVYSYLFRKKSQVWIGEYFQKYYDELYAYAIEGSDLKEIKGDMSLKLSDEEFIACKLYKDVYKASSRYNASFTYHGLDCAIVDAAAQVRGERALQTAFVGKVLRAPNTYKGSGLYIYVKGNKRALPPTAMGEMHVIEENKKHVIWGEESERKYLTKAMKDKIFAIETNSVLVDFAISIQPGRTYFLLGYEDTLMIIPMEHKLDVNPVREFKDNFGKFLEIAELFNKKGE
ncbi:MAG: hypothetical protein J6328_01815 [Bacilli bacterium]|nr:hypothetical protein [Bacilli bacterium]